MLSGQLQQSDPKKPGMTNHHGRSLYIRAYNLARRSASLFLHSRLDMYTISGQWMGSPLRILLLDDGKTLDYISKMIFRDENVEISKKKRVSAFRTPCFASSDVDLVIVGANLLLASRYADQGFYLIPKWARLNLPIWDHPDKIISKLAKSAKDDMRIVRNKGYSSETTTDPAWLDVFYYQMYKPYTMSHFGEEAILHGYRHLKKTYKHGIGLIVKQCDQPVAGSIVQRRGDTLYGKFLGVVDGNENAAKKGATRALYYHSLLLAHSMGCKNLDCGHSRAFLTDGVLAYKMKWQMDVLDDDDGVGVFAISSPHKTEVSLRFLAQNRFFHLHNGSLKIYDEADY